MGTIHTLPTDKPSRLYSWEDKLVLGTLSTTPFNKNIYITSDEEIKDVRPHKGKWQLEQGHILNKFPTYLTDLSECKLVIMTTDQDLIKDGVQAIDDEFLEWFINNPSCEEVMVEKYHGINTSIAEVSSISGNDDYNWQGKGDFRDYKIIIPKEEPKQSAVEWLQEQLNKILIDNQIQQTLHLFEQAKQMEEEQRGYSEEHLIKVVDKFHSLQLNEFKSFLELLEFKKEEE